MDTLTRTLAALSDPTRRAILAQLKNGPATVNDLVQPFSVSQQAISKHLGYLAKAKLIRKTKEGRQSICELNPLPLRELEGWVMEYREFWEGAINRLDEFLKENKEVRNNGRSK
ncbi:ArsR/SmtB family transcription factor [Leptospira ognonensis]|uniref:ArsR/SmtB family transcription factor n=1 Tax=Leptospira ognonensis TaxID=2484945 RepID=UPI001FE6760C|nr:metalloregulator ArsR/SmtB family transcription factor [Leptospira ognonensis]